MTVTVFVVVPIILPASALSELATLPVGVQELTEQEGKLFHCKFEPHIVVPEPDHPGSHVTVIILSITPAIESVAALSEFNTCVDGHLF